MSTEQLQAGLDHIREAPAGDGLLELIVRRPAVDERELLQTVEVTAEEGVVGDTWRLRGSRRMPDGGPDPRAKVTMMSSRAIALVARGSDQDDWAQAGDQLYVDLDISEENLPAGTRLHIGSVVLSISETPHTGCEKFAARFGMEAARFVNSAVGRELRLRGLNAAVEVPGRLSVGDKVVVSRPS